MEKNMSAKCQKRQQSDHLGIDALVVVLSIVLTIALLAWMLVNVGNGKIPQAEDIPFGEKIDAYFGGQLDGIFNGEIPKKNIFRLNDGDMVAPAPVPERYGQTDEPGTLQWLLDEADSLLDGQETLFSTQTAIKEKSIVYYYLDETIFAVTWKQVVDGGVYTFSEIKIGHPSQFRRFFSENKYGSGRLYTTTEMSETVNAVVAASGDYYGYRSIGIVVNNGQIYRDRGHLLDTCYIDDNGDMLFTYAGEITDMETLQQYVDANHIRFSLSFGPVMIENGINCVPNSYNSGEVNKDYARAALCQLDRLHYVLVAANMENPYLSVPTVRKFAENLLEIGIPRAYALDGGQTAAIAMDHQLMNTVSYGSQRKISDIIYFATALPGPTG